MAGAVLFFAVLALTACAAPQPVKCECACKTLSAPRRDGFEYGGREPAQGYEYDAPYFEPPAELHFSTGPIQVAPGVQLQVGDTVYHLIQ